MPVKDCVIVVKQTVLATGGRAAVFARRGDQTARRIHQADQEHRRTRIEICKAVEARGLRCIEYSVRDLNAAARRRISRADLVITIGGDGTVLNTSHDVTTGAMLGVNSAPGDSIGFFCSANRENFAEKLDRILADEWTPRRLARLAITLDGKSLPELALNDVLIAHECPAATTRYLIATGDVSEEHRSSGMWISTPIGSTAGIRSAGGRVQAMGSRRLQFQTRELYREHRRDYRLVRGFITPGETLIVASKMPEGELYIDGARTRYAFPFGARAEFRLADDDLRLYLDRRNI